MITSHWTGLGLGPVSWAIKNGTWIHLNVDFEKMLQTYSTYQFAKSFFVLSNSNFLEGCYVVNECYGARQSCVFKNSLSIQIHRREQIQARSLEKVVDEIEHLVNNYDLDSYFIVWILMQQPSVRLCLCWLHPTGRVINSQSLIMIQNCNKRYSCRLNLLVSL